MESVKVEKLNEEKCSFEMPEIIEITMPEALRGGSGYIEDTGEQTLDDAAGI